MKNKSLADDYLTRAGHRIAAVEVLLKRGAFADVVRESQELVELTLKALLWKCKIEVPRLHDVSDILLENQERVPKALHRELERISEISRQLRRDRELAFYGSEDLTPSNFYKKKDADRAFKDAKLVFSLVFGALEKK